MQELLERGAVLGSIGGLITEHPEMIESCKDCRFYFPHEENHLKGQGLCRRFPAVPIFLGVPGNYATSFPQMTEAGWCGEYKKS